MCCRWRGRSCGGWRWRNRGGPGSMRWAGWGEEALAAATQERAQLRLAVEKQRGPWFDEVRGWGGAGGALVRLVRWLLLGDWGSRQWR